MSCAKAVWPLIRRVTAIRTKDAQCSCRTLGVAELMPDMRRCSGCVPHWTRRAATRRPTLIARPDVRRAMPRSSSRDRRRWCQLAPASLRSSRSRRTRRRYRQTAYGSRRNHDRPLSILALPHCSVCALVHTASCSRVARRGRRPRRSCRAEGLTMGVSLEGAAIVSHPCCVGGITHQHRMVAQHIAAGHALPRPIAPSAAVIAHHRGEKRGGAIRFMAVWTARARTRQGRFIRGDHGDWTRVLARQSSLVASRETFDAYCVAAAEASVSKLRTASASESNVSNTVTRRVMTRRS